MLLLSYARGGSDFSSLRARAMSVALMPADHRFNHLARINRDVRPRERVRAYVCVFQSSPCAKGFLLVCASFYVINAAKEWRMCVCVARERESARVMDAPLLDLRARARALSPLSIGSGSSHTQVIIMMMMTMVVTGTETAR